MTEPFWECECGWNTGLPPAVTDSEEFERRWDLALVVYRRHRLHECPLNEGWNRRYLTKQDNDAP